MIANMISFGISKKYQPIPLYRALLQQDHVHLPEPGTRAPGDAWKACDIMKHDFNSISPDSSVEIASRLIADSQERCFLVGNNRSYSGLVTRDGIEQALRTGMGESSIGPFLIKDAPHTHPDHSLEVVLKRLSESPGLVPVLSRIDVHHVEGVITPQTLIDLLHKAEQSPSLSRP